MNILLPVLFMLLGLGAGIGAGVTLPPTSRSSEAVKHSQDATNPTNTSSNSSDMVGENYKKSGYEYIRMAKQFVVPVVDEDRIAALVTMTLSLEASVGTTEAFYAIEPKLRDGFLQVMFDHANSGGFDGAFTESDNLEVLRKALLEEARKSMGGEVSRVLIMSVSRQDV
ncbi:flagellar basal body-associated FliL family protein [Ruegeria profundi]|uniref:Flagellar basal body-associated protein FliL n=1 Tax=Ruegeria profundi TaxID=1685378 RepID=A0A0X3TTA2_9RHOB|nr:flagellar basal body-associated protein FliL [Ruegeria profundi]